MLWTRRGNADKQDAKEQASQKPRLSVQIFILVGEGGKTEVRTGQGCKSISEGGKVNKQ